MKEILFNLPLLNRVTVSIYDNALAEFVCRQMKNYIVNTSEKRGQHKYYVHLALEDASLAGMLDGVLIRDNTLARNIFVSNHILYNGNTRYKIAGNKLILESSKKILCYRKWIARLRGGFYAFYHSLFYELVLFPVFWLFWQSCGNALKLL